MKDALLKFRSSVLRSLKLQDFVNEYRVRYPGTALRIDAGNSPTSAIELKCRECSGDNHPRECPGYSCPLFPYRPGADDDGANQRRAGDVPTEEQYRELLRLADPDGLKAQAFRERVQGARASASVVDDELDF